MIGFRTKLDIPAADSLLGHQHRIMLIGSCFSDSIGQKLLSDGFRVLINPFGVLYNPVSIANNLQLLLDNQPHDLQEIKFNKSNYYHFNYHSTFSGDKPEEVLEKINHQLAIGREFLKSSDYLIITLGSAYTYHHLSSPEPVANCHKIPDKEFSVRMLTQDEIVNRFKQLLVNIRKLRPDLRILFTISPVRHWKYGAHGNQLSKAVLLLAVDEIIRQNPEYCSYFPSYELIMDELRDYRFYTEDMLHISNLAVDYIYEQFSSSYMDKATRQIAGEIAAIWQASRHRVMHPGTSGHERFLQTQIEKIQKIKDLYPEIDVDYLSKYFENQLREIRKLA